MPGLFRWGPCGRCGRCWTMVLDSRAMRATRLGRNSLRYLRISDCVCDTTKALDYQGRDNEDITGLADCVGDSVLRRSIRQAH